MSIIPSRARDILHWLDDRARDNAQPYSDMTMFREAAELIRRLQAGPSKTAKQQPVAWMTHHDEPMLFLSCAEALTYCDDDETPIPLYAAKGDEP